MSLSLPNQIFALENTVIQLSFIVIGSHLSYN